MPPPQFPLARHGAGHAPPRRPGSIRRTTSIDVRWPDGLLADRPMIGRARDIATPATGGAPVTLAAAGFTITASPRREIVAIEADPAHPRLQELVGVRAGGASREALGHVMGDVAGGPLFQLLDDFAGVSLVSGWIWAHWQPDWLERMRAQGPAAGARGPTLGVCTGFAEGSSALDAAGMPSAQELPRTEVLPLPAPDDPDGWHAMPDHDGPTMRRARRIDLWRDGGSIRVDAGFQDSGVAPDGARLAIHEYRVHAVLDAATGAVRALQALPLILPFAECPGASINASRMIGRPVAGFRQSVLDTLPGIEGCTHLNDVLRAMADVPALATRLPE